MGFAFLCSSLNCSQGVCHVDPPGRNLLCAVAKCFIITLVPFRSVGLSANGGSGEGSPEVEVVSDSRLENLLQSPQVHGDQDELNQVDLGLGLQSEAQIGDIGSGDFSLPDELDPAGRLGDFRSSFGFDESVRGTSVFEEPQQLDEPVTSSSNSSRVVHHNFLSNVKLHDIEMPWEQGVTKFVFGDELLPSESLAAQPMWPTSSLVVEARSHDDVATGLDTLLKAAGEVHHSSCFFSAGSNLADVRYVDKKKLELESGCTKWISILKLCHGASSVSEHIFMDDSDESLNSNMEVVEAIIGVRSATTAISRAHVFRKLLAWVIGNFPESSQTLDEHKVWKYCVHDALIACQTESKNGEPILEACLKLEYELCLNLWMSGVPTDSNIADDPSRGQCATMFARTSNVENLLFNMFGMLCWITQMGRVRPALSSLPKRCSATATYL